MNVPSVAKIQHVLNMSVTGYVTDMFKEIQAETKRYEVDLENRRLDLERERLEMQGTLGQNVKQVAMSHPRVSPKLPAFTEKENLDAYLSRFERFATSHDWPTNEWAINLSTLLTGKALETYYRLPVEQASQYHVVKDALLQRYQLTEAGFRTKFFDIKAEITENAVEFLSRIDGYLTRWVQLAKVQETYESLRDLLLKEQLLNTCDKTLAMFSDVI